MSNVFCYAPWTNIDIDQQGVMMPCCKYLWETKDVTNINTHSINDYINSPFLNKVKDTFNEGQWPKGCDRCKIEEQAGIKSKRQLDQEQWGDQYKDYDFDNPTFVTASIAFGNTCNLKCIICNAYSSSKWQAEFQKIYGNDIKPNHFYKDDFVDTFIEVAPTLKNIDIVGGEPFLSGVKQQKQLLQHYIDTGVASELELHYTTNATIFPDDSWWLLWSKFKTVRIQLSIDDIEDRFQYIRFPADWNEVLENISLYQRKCFDNIILEVATTVSAFNIFYLDELLTWTKSIGLSTPWLGRLHIPSRLRPTIWTASGKQAIIQKLKQSSHSELEAWVSIMEQNDDSDKFDEFKYSLMRHDNYRKNNFRSTFPEIAMFLNV
jgi:MoaA/NifB/PqqE/SkfB family radical SAM enzyme